MHERERNKRDLRVKTTKFWFNYYKSWTRITMNKWKRYFLLHCLGVGKNEKIILLKSHDDSGWLKSAIPISQPKEGKEMNYDEWKATLPQGWIQNLKTPRISTFCRGIPKKFYLFKYSFAYLKNSSGHRQWLGADNKEKMLSSGYYSAQYSEHISYILQHLQIHDILSTKHPFKETHRIFLYKK